jgi:hypothetical protein
VPRVHARTLHSTCRTVRAQRILSVSSAHTTRAGFTTRPCPGANRAAGWDGGAPAPASLTGEGGPAARGPVPGPHPQRALAAASRCDGRRPAARSFTPSNRPVLARQAFRPPRAVKRHEKLVVVRFGRRAGRRQDQPTRAPGRGRGHTVTGAAPSSSASDARWWL